MIDYEKLLKNCLTITKEEDFYFPRRIRQEKALEYERVDVNCGIKSKYTSGVCLDFISDTSLVSFEFKTGLCCHDYANFDLFVNDKYIKSLGYSVENNTKYFCKFNIKEIGKNRITIYFPNTTSAKIRNLKVSNNSTINYIEDRDYLLCLGDSITQGSLSHYSKSTYPVLLSRKLKLDVINQGVGGYFFDYKSLDEFIETKPKLISVAYGTNDWERFDDINQIIENIELYFKKLNEIYENIPIFVITPIWREIYLSILPSGSFFDVVAAIIKACDKYENMHIVDGMKLVPHEIKFFGDKVLHPNELGFEFYAENLYREIVKYR